MTLLIFLSLKNEVEVILGKKNGLSCKIRKIVEGRYCAVKNFHMIKFCQIVELHKSIQNL